MMGDDAKRGARVALWLMSPLAMNNTQRHTPINEYPSISDARVV